MKKLLCALILASIAIPSTMAFAETSPMVQVSADETSTLDKENELEGEELYSFIENHISENMPQEILDVKHEAYKNSSYIEAIIEYNKWMDQFFPIP
jgi:hypothetical protein